MIYVVILLNESLRFHPFKLKKKKHLFFYCSVITLQCCVSVFCTMKYIGYMYTDRFPLEPPSHFPILPLSVIAEHQAELPVL